MLIAISGPQSSGKSSIVNKLGTLGYNIISRKTSRSILTDWGMTLQEINNNPEITIRFQDEILKRKQEDEKHAISDFDNLYFTERSYADLMTYFLASLGKDNTYDNQLRDYYKKCIIANQHYHMVFYLKSGHFVVEQDGIRGINVHYSRMIDLTMLDLTQQMIPPSRLNVIDTPDFEQRMNIIESQSKYYIKGKKYE